MQMACKTFAIQCTGHYTCISQITILNMFLRIYMPKIKVYNWSLMIQFLFDIYEGSDRIDNYFKVGWPQS